MVRISILKGLFTVFAACLLWSFPSLSEGYAQEQRADPAGELQPQQHLEEVREPEALKKVSSEGEVPETSELFLMSSSLEPADEDAYAIEQVSKLLRSDLAHSFGLGGRRVETLVEQGRIRFEIDLDSRKAAVITEARIQREEGEASLFSPLDGGILPARIDYRMGHQPVSAANCRHEDHCDSETEHFLSEAEFTAEHNGRQLRYLLEYRTESPRHPSIFNSLFSNSELKEVSVYDVTHENPGSCREGLLCGQLVQSISISKQLLKGAESSGGQRAAARGWQVRIVSTQGFDETPAVREVFLRTEKGLLFATRVTDYTDAGERLVQIALDYEVHDSFTVCEAPDCESPPEISLWRVLFCDDGGSRIAEVLGFWKTNDGKYAAGVTFTGGKTASVVFRSVEELLREIAGLQRGF